jgi:DNA-binding NtrC family response regulator
MKSILIISESQDAMRAVRACFGSDCGIESASTREVALSAFKSRRFDLLFVDLEILRDVPGENGYGELLEPFWQVQPGIDIIVLAPQKMIREAVKAVKMGASDYLTYPIDPEEIKYVIENLRESVILQSELDYLRDQFWEADALRTIQTKNSRMKTVFEKVRSVAPTKTTVLLTGETGTGKGVLAGLIHRHSNRRDAQFISVHCGAIPDTLLESELFGHEKGAFTGAVRRKLGKFEIANGGTIFLDEIGTVTPSAQIKLLQVLQDGTFHRVGGEQTITADVRVISATNVDLKEMCDQGRFRKDLYYRLNVFPVEIPALQERIEDIPPLARGFLDKMRKQGPKEIREIDPRVLEAFRHYSWQGNIRELENLMERAYILETSDVLTPESFPSELFESEAFMASVPVNATFTLSEVKRKALEDVERNYLKELLGRHRGKIKESAEVAGITTRQLHKLMAKHGLRKEEFK